MQNLLNLAPRMAKPVRIYLRALDKYPLLTQSLSSGTLMAAGDVIAQLAVEGKSFKQFEPKRTGRIFAFGTFVIGPMLVGWFGVLEKMVRNGTATSQAVKKMALDQGAFAPVYLTFYIGCISLWKSKSLETVKRKLNKDFGDVMVSNWKLWPAAQMVNFYFIPLHYRVLYVQVVNIIWNTYMSHKTEGGHVEED